MTAPSWLDVLDEAIRAAATHHRPELANYLQRKRARLLDPALRVLVIGEPNQGKSQLVNALVNAPVCAVGDDLTTAVSTVVAHSDLPSATLLTAAPGTPAIYGGPPQAERVPVPIEQLGERLAGMRRAGNAGARLVAAEIGLPRRLLESGLVLIDSPAISNPRRPDFAALGEADVVLLTSDATSELSATELDLLCRLSKFGQDIVVAITKIDLVPHWRQLAERNRSLLAGAGVPASLVPVSAVLRLHAAKTGDPTLNAESGFGSLIEHLQQLAAAKPTRLAPRAAALTAGQVVQQLRAVLSGRLGPAPSNANAPAMHAQKQLEELRRAVGRCHTMLADEMADLNSDLEYDLRDRARKILREVDRTFDKADPANGWEEFERWLEANLTEAAQANFSWLIERCHWIAEKLVKSYPEYPACVPQESIPEVPADPLDDISELERPGLERFTVGQKVFTGLRGSYGGVLMFGLVTSLTVGLPLINPISLGAGAVFGGKSVKEESETRLRRRQAAAKAAAQRHVDDFFLKFGKDCKDVTRHIQRSLRDHFAGLAVEMQESIAATITASKQETTDTRRELEDLAGLLGRIQALVA